VCADLVLMDYFYTTGPQEEILKARFEEKLAIKAAEIREKERRERRIQKYTARAYVSREPRIFIVKDGAVYFEEVCEANLCPLISFAGGAVYTWDTHFSYAIRDFQKRNRNYTVVFNPDGMYGSMMHFMGSEGSMPASLTAEGGETIMADHEGMYDIGCL
jgi:hypothetical protein